MRELALFEQYLVQLRQEKLQNAHQQTLGATDARDFRHIYATAQQAELIQALLVALRALNNDPGMFLKEYMK